MKALNWVFDIYFLYIPFDVEGLKIILLVSILTCTPKRIILCGDCFKLFSCLLLQYIILKDQHSLYQMPQLEQNWSILYEDIFACSNIYYYNIRDSESKSSQVK